MATAPSDERFEDMLAGGHPNSLGRTVEVVGRVLADPARFEDLLDCYRSADPVVRLRTSSALKRIEPERHDLLVGAVDRLIEEVGRLDQPSAQWTLAQLFGRLAADLSPDQRTRALALMERNLAEAHDWIVLTTTIDTLCDWAAADPDLAGRIVPHLERLSADPRRSVAGRARTRRAALRPAAMGPD